MQKKTTIIGLVVLIGAFCFTMWGCEETPKPKPVKKIVKQKIVSEKIPTPATQKIPSSDGENKGVSGDNEAKMKAETGGDTTADKTLKDQPASAPSDDQLKVPEGVSMSLDTSKNAISKQDKTDSLVANVEDAESVNTDVSEKDGEKVSEGDGSMSDIGKPTPTDSSAPEPPQNKESTPFESQLLAALEKGVLYNPIGKLNPFIPLVKEKAKEPEPEKEADTKQVVRRKKTPLEKLDLSQLKLTAIFNVENERKALVEEVTGKGYVVKDGTYIGLHSGRVVDILPGKIVIEEEVTDPLGKLVVRKSELKLQKPLGE